MRKYDLLILGAATPLGALVLKHVRNFLPKGLKWAIVGQLGEEGELESAVGKYGEGAPAIEICSYSKSEIATLVKSTKVIIMLPVQSVREQAELWIVEACSRNRTHYVDAKSGETCWLKAMIHKYHDAAKDTGAILLSHVNAVGATQDLLTLCAVTDLSEKLSLKTKEAICSFPTVNSPRLHNTSHRKHHPRDSSPPWYLSPIQGRDGSCNTNAFGLRKDSSLGLLANTSPSAAQNQALVHRSWALLDGGKRYGTNFFYNEYEEVPNTIEGIRARMGKRRRVIDVGCRKDKESRLSLRVVAVADQEGPFPDRALAELSYHGDIVQLTAALVVQAAATMLYNNEWLKRIGTGFLTPAVLGKPFVERLRGIGVEIETSLL